MTTKFKQVPVDIDTQILYQREVRLGDYEALHQMWSWDGVEAESIIFDSEDVASLSDDELEKIARKSTLIKSDSSITLTRTPAAFTFINFNFEA